MPPAIAEGATPTAAIRATGLGQQIPCLSEAGEDEIDVDIEDIGHLLIGEARQHGEQQDLAKIKRQCIQPKRLLGQERQRSTGRLRRARDVVGPLTDAVQTNQRGKAP